jgi:hypothetical protein
MSGSDRNLRKFVYELNAIRISVYIVAEHRRKCSNLHLCSLYI